MRTLTDSTTPKVSPLVTSEPGSGSSTYTTSPSSLCMQDDKLQQPIKEATITLPMQQQAEK
jgi:hypothetical protein